ncbi:MAG: adenylate/guanylate cyclase domain-containing protein [Candidatus Limnocylindria bacterium]
MLASTSLAEGAAGPAAGVTGSRPAHVPEVDVAAATAERRLVSILFADLVGFTALSESRDAETVREQLTRYFDAAREIVGRYGGTVEKFIGDAVMAVWGAPTAHEDDAERAVRAALDLVEAVRGLGSRPDELQARAAVLTGEAAVTIGAEGQGMVAGDLVNTASRLQSAAPPGSVLVGQSTRDAASVAISFEPIGEQALKGKSVPVPAWRAVRVVARRGGAGRYEGLEPPFEGRDEELRLVKELFHATERERRPRLVTILGQAGSGKSRLIREFEKYTDGLVGAIQWHTGRSPSYGEGVTFWALGEMIRKRAGLAETDDEETTRGRIAATLADDVPDEGERRWIEPRLLELLGVGEGRSGEREEVFAAWRAAEALTGFSDSTRELRELGVTFLVALSDLDVLATVGADAAAARSAAEAEAREILGGLRATALLARLDALLAGTPAATSRSSEHATAATRQTAAEAAAGRPEERR